MKLKGRYYTLLGVVIIRVLFSFSSLDSCYLRQRTSTSLMHSNSLTQCDKKHNHQQNILQSIVYCSIVRREPSESQTCLTFPMVADSGVFISHKQSGTIPDGRETASAMIADELRYVKTRL